MIIRTINYCSGRTRDGRVFVLPGGYTAEAAEDDADKVALFKSFVDSRDAVIDQTAEKPAEKTEQPAAATTTTYVRYEDRTVTDLRELARSRQLSTSGTKDELIARLRSGQ